MTFLRQCRDTRIKVKKSLVQGTPLADLRRAVQENRVSFPAQVPRFPQQYRSEVQWRLVVLYFVLGWSCAQLGERYHVTSRRVRQSIRQWVDQAEALGYIGEVTATEDSRRAV